jgi:hydroxymethylglutaryl-CoA reductase (NADPH)
VLLHIANQKIAGHADNFTPTGLHLTTTLNLGEGKALALRCTFGDVCHLNLAGRVAQSVQNPVNGVQSYTARILFTAVREWERDILSSTIHEIHHSHETHDQSILHVYVANDMLADEATELVRGEIATDRGQRDAGAGRTQKIPNLTTRDLLPKVKRKSYTSEAADIRRDWLSQKCGTDLPSIRRYSDSPDTLRGNIENFIGSAQIPIGITGPLIVNGQHAKGTYYVPLATTEGALTYTCTEGMLLISLAGGATTTILNDQLDISPIFTFNSLVEAKQFCEWSHTHFQIIKQHAESTTRHAMLVKLEPHLLDKNVVLKFSYETGDAMGINMVTFATEEACNFITASVKVKRFYLQPNFSSIKKVTAHHFIRGYGKTVVAEAVIPAGLIRRSFHISPREVVDFYHTVRLCAAHVGMVGINGHTANMLAAIYTACGQDIACVVDSHVGVTNFDVTDEQALYVSVKLPSLLVGTVGGGTALSTQRECLQLLGCAGQGKAKKFAEIVAASILAGELAICARVANGTFAQAHRKYGRKAGHVTISSEHAGTR